MSALPVLPLLVPLATAAVCMALRRRRALQRVVSVAGAVLLLAAALALLARVRAHGIQVVHVGGWPAPFGITLVADLLAAILATLTGFMGLTVTLYSLAGIDSARETHGYHPLLHVLLMGVGGAFLTGDIFNLYVCFEVMLIASFALLVLGGERAQMEGAVKYVTLNLMSSALFLVATGILYGTAGSLNLADLAVKLRDTNEPGLVTAIGTLFLVAFGIKAALFPLFFWLPAAYHTPPAAVSALFAGLLTKVGIYALIRVFTLIFMQETGYTHAVILVAGAITMVVGVLGAVAQEEFRRVLAFHSISQIGYMAVGLGLLTRSALAGSIFFLVHHSVVKANLFLVSGAAARLRGTYELKRLGGLATERPILAALFLVSALSLAGLPPFSGFFAKLALVQAAFRTDAYLVGGLALAVGLLTLFSMNKIWQEAFWKPAPEPAQTASKRAPGSGLLGPIVILAAAAVGLGLGAGPCYDLALAAAEQLLDSSAYVHAVLGDRP